jgi:hypothetical protein
VRDQCFERSRLQVARHELHRTAGHTDVLGDALVLQLEQRLDRAAECHALVERDVLRVMQIQQLDRV